MPRMKGAELITDYLIANDIPYVFGICGHGNVGMLDPLYEARDRIKLVSPRHEQVAGPHGGRLFPRAPPAGGDARPRAGRARPISSCRWPCALTDSSAVLAITANVPTSQFNRSPFQEINRHFQADFVNVLRPVVKRSFQPTRVDMLPLALRQAMTTMLSGRPGPVNIDVPFNVFQEEDDVEMPPPAPPFNTQRSGASPDDIARALDMILAAQRPVLFIGHGVTLSEASRELTEFANKLGIPVISSPNGMGCIDMTDPLSLGFIGRNGAFPANEAGRRADVVIAIGGALRRSLGVVMDARLFVEFPAHKAHPCRRRSGRARPQLSAGPRHPRRRAHLPAPASCRTGAARRQARRHQGMARRHREMARRVGDFIRPNFDIHASPMRPERVVADCQAVLPPDGIICCDVGVSHNWYMQFWNARQPQTMLNSWGFSGMGFGAVRRARRQAGRAGSAGGRGHRRRLLHHGAACAVHRGRIRHSGGVGDLEQFRLGLDPRHPARHVRRPRTRHHVPPGRQQETVQSGFRRLGESAPASRRMTVTKSEDFRGALEHAIKANKPFLLDVHVDAEVRPPSTGAWELPPTPYKEPVFGQRFIPDAAPVK